MKVTLIFLLALAMAGVNSCGQTHEAEVSHSTQLPAKKKSTPSLFAPDRPPLRAVPKKVILGGVLAKISKTDKPLQLINPFAPTRYGSGLDELVVDSQTGKALGVSLISIRR